MPRDVEDDAKDPAAAPKAEKAAPDAPKPDASPPNAPKPDAPRPEDRPTAASGGPPGAAPPARMRRGGRRGLRYVIIAAVALVAVAFAGREVMLRLTHVYEYDARVVTDHVTIGSVTEGNLVSLTIDAGDTVDAGQVLAQVDDRVPTLELEALKAERAGVEAERAEILARNDMVSRQTDSRYKTRLTSIQAEQARRAALAAELKLARQDLERFQNLFERRVIARASLDRAESEVTRLVNEMRRAEADIAASRGEAAEAEADKGELAIIARELARLDFKEAQLAAQIARQETLIDQRAIKAPIAGIVDRVFVEKGEYIGEGRRILMLHNPDDVWVEANIKETEVRRLKPGQRVAVTVDAYPDDEFVGRVALIGTAATSRFALLPTPNPSGNFTKVTQRIPVKIVFEKRPRPLAPGMMVEVEIDVSEDG